MAPTDPLQGTAEPLRQVGGSFKKTCLRKGKTTTQAVRSEEKSVRNSPADTQVTE